MVIPNFPPCACFITKKINLFFFTLIHTHYTHCDNTFFFLHYVYYGFFFFLHFATSNKSSQIFFDLYTSQKNIVNKTQTLLSLSRHYLPSENSFFFFTWFHAQLCYIFFSLHIREDHQTNAIKFFAVQFVHNIQFIFLCRKEMCCFYNKE